MQVRLMGAMVAGFGASAMGATVTPYFGQTLNAIPGTSTPAVLNAGSAVRVAQQQFLARLAGNSTQSFESFSNGLNANGLALTFTGSAGPIGATLTRTGPGTLQVAQGNISGAYATEGSKYIFTDSSTSGGFAIDFAQPTAGFGFTTTDIGDFGVKIGLKLTNGTTVNIPIPHAVGANGNVSANAFFFGVVAEDFAFDRVEFTITAGPTFDSFGFDEMTIGDPEQVVPVPLPHASGLAMAGLGMLAIRRRRMAL